jgi:hypothetical protein
MVGLSVMEKLSWLRSRNLFAAVLIGFCLFLFAGGFNVLDGLTSGFSTISDARFGVTAVFFAGFLFTGLFGLGYALKNRLVPKTCLLGFVMVVFSYFGIEVLFMGVIG